ncbi:Leptin receptor overlapping transcript-like 1 [Mactra antiquata]
MDLYCGRNRLIGLAFLAAVGITLLVLGCALDAYQNWWPMFVLIFYFLVPVPTIISRRMSNSFDTASSACMELCIFLTTGIVISCMSLPIILARASVIEWGACALAVSGSIVVFLTILGYFYVFANEDLDYSMW